MRLRGIATREEANQFLRESYIAELNRRFAVTAAQPESAFVPMGNHDLERIFSLQQERVVNRDNTVSVGGRVLQIDRTRWRGTLARCRVLACEHQDGSVSVYYGPHLVGRYPSETKSEAAAESCGKDAAWKPLKTGVPTPLGNPAKNAGFPLSHSSGDDDPSPSTGQITC